VETAAITISSGFEAAVRYHQKQSQFRLCKTALIFKVRHAS
jgi:hypothetical protein